MARVNAKLHIQLQRFARGPHADPVLEYIRLVIHELSDLSTIPDGVDVTDRKKVVVLLKQELIEYLERLSNPEPHTQEFGEFE